MIKGSGITLGAIPSVILYGAAIWMAKILCKKWDEHRSNNAPSQTSQKEESPIESNATQGPDKVAEASDSTNDNATMRICFCRRCGEKLIENSRFCRKCGTEITKE